MRSLYWTTKLRIVSAISAALAYVHYGCPELNRPGIVHRNINPGNILISYTEDSDTLLCDFRQSRDLDSDLGLILGSLTPRSGSKCSDLRNTDDWIVGTPGYADPLYFRTRIYTPHSDIYSLGMILLQMLLGVTVCDEESLERYDYYCNC